MIVKSYEIQKRKSDLTKCNLFLLYGENIGLKKDTKKKIEFEIKQKNSNTEFSSIYESDITENTNNFYNSIYSGSLFGTTKVIAVNNGTDKIIKLIEDITEKYPENVFIIILSEILDKKSKLRNFFEKNPKTICIPCYLDNARDLEIIIAEELKKNNINLARESINLLVEKSNYDRDNLRNEIEKIKSYALTKKSIGIEEIRYLINFSGEHKSDNLINECLSGNIYQYKKILTELYTNTINQIFLLRILSNKMRRLLNLKEKEMENNYNNVDSLLNASKPPIFWKEKPIVKKQLTIWNIGSLTKTIDEINNIELLCKKNPQISKIIFFNFFSDICKKAKNFS